MGVAWLRMEKSMSSSNPVAPNICCCNDRSYGVLPMEKDHKRRIELRN